jgi:hypothetical protein
MAETSTIDPARARAIELADAIQTVGEAPTLYRWNGVGTTLLGWYGPPDMQSPTRGQLYYTRLFWTVLFVPVFAGKVYVVLPVQGGYRFLGQLSAAEFRRLYPGAEAAIYARSLFAGLLIAAWVIGALFLFAWLAGVFGVRGPIFLRFRL